MKKKNEPNSTDNPLYHNTWTLLKKYRDVVWSLELSVQQVRNTFEIEYGNRGGFDRQCNRTSCPVH